jgi:site-specific recombinase XerD
MHNQHPKLTTSILMSRVDTDFPLYAADAIKLIESWHDLPASRQRELTSAVSSVVRKIGMPADNVVLSPDYLRKNILCLSPKALDVSKIRKSNIFSGLSFVMEREGIIDRIRTPIASEWGALMETLNKRQRPLLNRLAHYGSLHAVKPDAVTSATLEAFEFQLMTRTLTRDPSRLVGRIRGLWNRSVGKVAGWPMQTLPLGRKPGQYALPLDAFPESFGQDLDVLGRQMAGNALDDPYSDLPDFDDQAPLASTKPLRQTTIELRQSHCRWAASALAATGVPITEIIDLRSLVVPLSHVRDILRFFWVRAGNKPSAAGSHVAEVLRIIALYHVRLPAKDVAKIKKYGDPVRLVYRGMTPKNEASVRQIMSPQQESDLLELPDAFMKAAHELRLDHPQEAKTLAMRAVAIEILTKIPLRLSNLLGLRLDRHLQRPDPRSGPFTHIVIDILEETKNSRAIYMPISRKTAKMMQEWITHFRPLVGSSDCVFLFPHNEGGNRPVTPQGLRESIKKAMAEHVGVVLTPHQFRHRAARVFLEMFPGHYEEVRQLLGHASIATTIRYYSGIESEASVRRYDEVVLNRRRTLKGAKGKR